MQRVIREWSNSSAKGQGHNQSKGKGKGKRKHPGTGNQNEDQAGSLDEETGQRKFDDCGIKRQRIEFVGDVPEHNENFEAHKGDRAAYVFCVQKSARGMTDWMELPSSSKSGVQVSEEPAGTQKIFYQSTGESLFAVRCRDDRPIVDSGSVVSTCPMDYATSIPTKKVHYSMNLESVLGESLQHYGIKRNVLVTKRIGSTMNVNFEVTDTKTCNSVCAQRLRQWLDDCVHSRWKG